MADLIEHRSNCNGKTRYHTYRSAELGLSFVVSHTGFRSRSGYRLHIYRCRCRAWHLGNSAVVR